jgi:hypothetical protein
MDGKDMVPSDQDLPLMASKELCPSVWLRPPPKDTVSMGPNKLARRLSPKPSR